MAELEVRSIPAILQLEDFMPLIQAEAIVLDGLTPEGRERLIEVHKAIDARMDHAFVHGADDPPQPTPGTSCHCWTVAPDGMTPVVPETHARWCPCA